MTFIPHFVEGVTETIFNVDPITHLVKEINSPVNPVYCLSADPNDPGGVQAFVKMFPLFAAQIIMDNPEGPGFWGGFAQTPDGSPYSAPFIVWSASIFSTGPMNAGVMANIYNHGYPESSAYAQVVTAVTSQLGF